jgi:hypothetical protein
MSEDTVTLSRAEYERLLEAAEAGDDSLTIEEFCRAEKVSRSTYYVMRDEKWGPTEMRVGDSVRISAQARRQWRKEREAAAAAGVGRKLGEAAHA